MNTNKLLDEVLDENDDTHDIDSIWYGRVYEDEERNVEFFENTDHIKLL